jgi:hypothetical protein
VLLLVIHGSEESLWEGGMKWDWVLWQVVAPLFTPVVISVAAVFFSELGPHPYPIKWDILADTSPWALAFFSLTLIGSALHDLWLGNPRSPLVGFLMVVGLFVAIFASYLVYWRQTESDFTPGAPIYYTMVVFFFGSIGLCHEAAR